MTTSNLTSTALFIPHLQQEHPEEIFEMNNPKRFEVAVV
jgi:hypothetical protein